MVSLFSSLNIASNALTVNESAISVVSHNVANMNTEGYSKQKVNLATRNIAGAIGNNVEAQVRSNGGVMIANVMRYNNDYLNNYYRTQLSKLNEYEQQLGNLGDLADIFNDLDGTGIDGALSNFYDAMNNLNEYPASSTARTNFIESAKTLVNTMNTKSQQLNELTGKALGDGSSQASLENSKIYVELGSFNDKLQELAEVNKALQVTQTGTLQANNLLDKRDVILNEIAKYVDINVEEKQNGSVTVFCGNTALVRGAKVTGELSVQTAKDYCKNQVPPIQYPEEWVDEDGNPREAAVISINGDEYSISDANSVIKGGTLGGLIHSTDNSSDTMTPGKVQTALNNLSQVIADVFNDMNTRENAFCIDPNNTGLLTAEGKCDIFTTKDGSTKVTAANITLNDELLTETGIWKISCAYFDDMKDFDPRAVGNSQNISGTKNTVGMLGTRNQKQYLLNGMSIEDYYTGILGKIAAGGSSAQNLYDTQSDVVDSIANQIEGGNSVDLNEELMDLVKYQTAYSASAQVFNTVNNCLDTLMTLGR